MSQLEISNLDKTFEVGAEYLKGKNTAEIVRATGLKRGEVEKHTRAYKQLMKEMAKSNVQLADRLQIALEESLQHYDVIKKEAWANKEEAEQNGDIKSVNTALRLIADLQKTQFQMVESVQEGTDVELLEELDRTQEQHQLLKSVLMGLKEKYPEAFKWVRNQLSTIMEDVEVMDSA